MSDERVVVERVQCHSLVRELARRTVFPVSTTETVVWEIRDPSGTSVRGIGPYELDPDGMDVGMENPYINQSSNYFSEPEESSLTFYPMIGGGAYGSGNWGCTIEGISRPCGFSVHPFSDGGVNWSYDIRSAIYDEEALFPSETLSYGPNDLEIRRAMIFCINKLYAKKGERWSVGDYEFSSKDQSGWVNVNVVANGVFTNALVVNDVGAYSAKDLAYYGKTYGPLPSDKAWLAGLTLWNGHDAPSKKPFEAGRNYTANDLSNYLSTGLETKLPDITGWWKAVQIHELGVSMEKITGIQPVAKGTYAKKNGKYDDPDSGMALEECVYERLSN